MYIYIFIAQSELAETKFIYTKNNILCISIFLISNSSFKLTFWMILLQ